MSLDNDAREFGQYIKQGSWRLGLLVARNCEPGKPGRPAAADPENRTHELVSGPDELSPDSDTPSKVSQTAFAGKAGVSQSYVSTYYRAWQLAAEDGLCQRTEDLSPGEEDLEDFEEEDVEHTRELWSKYLEKARKPKKSRTTGNAQGSAAADSAPEAKHNAPDDKVSQAVRALNAASEQLSKNLLKVLNSVGIKLVGDDADLAKFAEDLRQNRFALDKQCREIDQLLDRIGFGDAEPEDAENAEDGGMD